MKIFNLVKFSIPESTILLTFVCEDLTDEVIDSAINYVKNDILDELDDLLKYQGDEFYDEAVTDANQRISLLELSIPLLKGREDFGYGWENTGRLFIHQVNYEKF